MAPDEKLSPLRALPVVLMNIGRELYPTERAADWMFCSGLSHDRWLLVKPAIIQLTILSKRMGRPALQHAHRLLSWTIVSGLRGPATKASGSTSLFTIVGLCPST
jgi:hypothetical protein